MSPAPPTSLIKRQQISAKLIKSEYENNNGKYKVKVQIKNTINHNNNIHFDGAFGAEICFQNVLKALSGVDIHVKCCWFVQHFRVRIQDS